MMSKYTYTLPAIIIVILAVGIAIWSFLKIGPNNPAAKPPVTKTTAGSLPISPANKAIKSVTAIYTFQTSIKEIKKNSYGADLITDIKAQNPPRLFVSDKTKVYRVVNSQEETLSLTDIAPKQKVEILIYYEIKKKLWYTISAVNILNDTQP